MQSLIMAVTVPYSRLGGRAKLLKPRSHLHPEIPPGNRLLPAAVQLAASGSNSREASALMSSPYGSSPPCSSIGVKA